MSKFTTALFLFLSSFALAYGNNNNSENDLNDQIEVIRKSGMPLKQFKPNRWLALKEAADAAKAKEAKQIEEEIATQEQAAAEDQIVAVQPAEPTVVEEAEIAIQPMPPVYIEETVVSIEPEQIPVLEESVPEASSEEVAVEGPYVFPATFSESEQLAVVEEPVTFVETEELAVVEEPVALVETEELAVVEEPVTFVETEELAVVEEEPVALVEIEELAVVEEPVTFVETEELAVVEEEPVALVEIEELAVVEEPVTFVETEELAVVEEECSNVEELAVVEEPVTFVETEELAVVEEECSDVEELAVAEEPAAVVETEELAVVEEECSDVEELAVAEEPAAVVETEELAVVEEECSDVEELAVAEEPAAVVEAEELAVVEEECCFAEEVAEICSAPEIICEDHSLIDEPIAISVVGLEPNQVISIEASWVRGDQIQWASCAQFRADQSGVVDLTEQAPLQGTYEVVDSMGLFWSMQMGNVVLPENCPFIEKAADCLGAVTVNFKVVDETGVIAEKSICRHTLLPDVEVIEMRENGLIGDLFIPNSDEALPVVIVLSGSEGGIPSGYAELLSSNGIAAFALAYTGVEGLPSHIENVPLEYFEKAFEWLQHHPRLSGEIYLYGGSRGAELALILGSMFPDTIGRIVAVAPSSVVLSSDAWLYRGEPVLPAAPYFVDFNYDFRNDFAMRETPLNQKIHLERGIYLESERFEAASIPVERIQCPILLISGGDDQLGPSNFYSKQILGRLEKYHSQIERLHLNYPKAGHLISVPYLPRINVFFDDWKWINVGGTPLADELASRDAWQHTLEFLLK